MLWKYVHYGLKGFKFCNTYMSSATVFIGYLEVSFNLNVNFYYVINNFGIRSTLI
jgi:hypothetical protein